MNRYVCSFYEIIKIVCRDSVLAIEFVVAIRVKGRQFSSKKTNIREHNRTHGITHREGAVLKFYRSEMSIVNNLIIFG